MRLHRRLRRIGVARTHGRDDPAMLADRSLVAVPFKLFVPLVMIVEDQRNHLLEIGHEAVLHHRVDGRVKGLVQP